MDYYKLKVLNNKKIIIIIVLILILASLGGYFYFTNQDDNKDIINTNNNILDNHNDEVSNDNIYVDIKGYVNKPGVYSFKLRENARVNDLITKAGGLLKDADTSTINLSKKLDDEMTVIIYSKNEVLNYVKTQDELSKKLEICENKLKNNVCIKQENTSNKININEANLEELMTLNGVGEAKAKAIISYREKTKFKSIEDIKNVEGIGESLFATIKENITI